MSAEEVANLSAGLAALYLDRFAQGTIKPKSGKEARLIVAACAAIQHDGVEIAPSDGGGPPLNLAALAIDANEYVCRACYGHGTIETSLCANCGGDGLNHTGD